MARAPRRRSKYGNVRCEVAGERFDSKAERDYWLELKLREKAGEVRNIRRQVKFPLIVRKMTIGHYIADFTFEEHVDLDMGDVLTPYWISRRVDVKGFKTPVYRLKAKIMDAMGQPVTEVSRSRR